MNQIGAVHLQEFNGHAPFWGSAADATANDLKVRGPVINPWIEESHQRTRGRAIEERSVPLKRQTTRKL